MKQKKIAAVLAGLMVLGCVGGCGNGGGTSQGNNNNPSSGGGGSSVFTGELEQNVKIRVLENDTAISKGYFAELIKAFNEEYAPYGIVAEDANMDQYLDLANDGPYGYGPDVLYQANDIIMQYVEGKHIYPLPIEKMDCYGKIPETAWDAYKAEIDGNTYYCGIPVNVQAPMLFYRKDMLPEGWEKDWDADQNGVPDMVESWTAMYDFSIQRHQQDPEKYGYMKSLYDPYFSCGYLFTYGAYVFGNNNTNPADIGFSAGEAEKGANVLYQLAGIMSEECIDETITVNSYTKLADGTYFATMTTPDVYSTFYDELVLVYKGEGMSEEEAREAATENLIMEAVPKLPESGDLTEKNPTLIDSKTMGGINGYAISSYTKYPNACLAFVDFATKYEQVILRNKMLGIAPAREDAAADTGDISRKLYANLEKGNTVLMPSIKEVAQIWTPSQTFFSDLAKDAFRPEKEKKYATLEAKKAGLKQVDTQIHDAIFTLQ